MIAIACLKWVNQRPEPETVLEAETPDGRFAGVSAADRAALEWALRTRETPGMDATPDCTVIAITVGPAGADAVLRDAVAAGAGRAIRVDLAFGAPSHVVASALAGTIRTLLDSPETPVTIWCGDYSFDRGTGSVPAYLAGNLGIAQALGLVAVEHTSTGIQVLRRLDGGRRERLSIDGPAVLSVEGSTALLRRAPLRALLSRPTIEVVDGWRVDAVGMAPPQTTETRPFRPRPRAFAPPAGQTALERVKSLTSAGTTTAHGETVVLEPDAAAERIIASLTEWGYLR